MDGAAHNDILAILQNLEDRLLHECLLKGGTPEEKWNGRLPTGKPTETVFFVACARQQTNSISGDDQGSARERPPVNLFRHARQLKI